jgi:hypothetical protein
LQVGEGLFEIQCSFFAGHGGNFRLTLNRRDTSRHGVYGQMSEGLDGADSWLELDLW